MSDNSENRKPLRCPFAESIRNPITPETFEAERNPDCERLHLPKQKGYVAIQVDMEQWNLFTAMFKMSEDRKTFPPDTKLAKGDEYLKDRIDPIVTDPTQEDKRVLERFSQEIGKALDHRIQYYVSEFRREPECGECDNYEKIENKLETIPVDDYMFGIKISTNTQHIDRLRGQATAGRDSDKDALFYPVDHTIKRLFEQAVLENGGDYGQLLEEALRDKAKELMGEDKAIELEAQLSALRDDVVQYLRRERLFQSQERTAVDMSDFGIRHD